MSVRIAVIGAGVMGRDHARIVAQDLPGAVLQLVCDSVAERARAVAEECGAGDCATDPLASIRRGDVDAVLLAGPDETHAPLTLAAIEAGKPVLCEKPLAPASEACLQVIQAEMRCGRQMLRVGFMRRFDAPYVAMKEALDAGDIGNATMMHNFHRNVESPPWFSGEMAISNSATHEFDAARFVLNAEYAAISAFRPPGSDATKSGAPVFMVLETTGGQLVTIEVNNNAAYGYDVRGELVGERGSVSLKAPVHVVCNSALQAVERYPADWRPRFAEAYRLQNKAWLRFVETGADEAQAANAWDGYCATRTAEAGVKSLASGRKIAIEAAEMPALYRADREAGV